jgi:ATP synthase protein I
VAEPTREPGGTSVADSTRPSRRSERFPEEIGRRVERRARAQREGERSLWFGLGMFGLVGWSVAIPTVIGIAVGVYLDGHYPVRFSWTLTLLVLGVAAGCLNAWYWIQQERHR